MSVEPAFNLLLIISTNIVKIYWCARLFANPTYIASGKTFAKAYPWNIFCNAMCKFLLPCVYRIIKYITSAATIYPKKPAEKQDLTVSHAF